MNVRVIGFRNHAPAIRGSHQGQIVGEIARRNGAIDHRMRRIRAGFVDRDDAVVTLQALAAGRVPAADQFEILRPGHIGDGRAVGRIQMGVGMKHPGELFQVAIIKAVEIVP